MKTLKYNSNEIDKIIALSSTETEQLICNSDDESSDSVKSAMGVLTQVGVEWHDTWAKVKWQTEKNPQDSDIACGSLSANPQFMCSEAQP